MSILKKSMIYLKNVYINSKMYVSALFVQGVVLGVGDTVVTQTFPPNKVQSSEETRH